LVITVIALALILYFIVLSYGYIGQALEDVKKKDYGSSIWIGLLVTLPMYAAFMIIKYLFDRKRRDLTHVVFMIIVGFVISVLITVSQEWYPAVPATSTVSFKNMSVSVERTSPFYIPIRSIIFPNNYADKPVIVKIYNYSSIHPVSVSMSTPPNVFFNYSKFNYAGYDPNLKSFVYFANISTKHTGHVFNSTDDYTINVNYRNIASVQKQDKVIDPSAKLSTALNSTSNAAKLNVTDITATQPLNRFNTVDNNLNTSWSSDGLGQSISYTLDKKYNITKIGIAFFKGNVRQNFFEINKENFTSSGSSNGLENFTLKAPLIKTNSIQIIGHGNSGGGNSKPTYNAFSEVRLYGPKPISPPAETRPDNTIYLSTVPFNWSVRMTDLSLTTYFWVVMAGVVTSRFMSLILDKSEGHRGHGKDDMDIQIIGWKDGLGILFSFIIAVILFSSFNQQTSSLTMMVLFNISIAFAFGFGFDKTLEVAPRFSSRYKADLIQNKSE